MLEQKPTLEQLRGQRDAAQILGVCVKTLERMRADGSGPPYIRVGRQIRFRDSDLISFIEASRRVR